MAMQCYLLIALICANSVLSEKPTKKPPGGSSVDNDPHFIVQLKNASHPLCFDVTGKDGDIYQLVHDADKEFYVNGRIFGTKVTKNGHQEYRTYFGGIMIMKRSFKVMITPSKIAVSDGSYHQRFRWRDDKPLTELSKGVSLTVHRQHSVTLSIDDNIVLTVAKHKRHRDLKFLGVYLNKGAGLSPKVGGLIGEFEYKKVVEKINPGSQSATLHVPAVDGTKDVQVILGQRLNMVQKVHVACWQTRKDRRGVLKYTHDAYLVPKMASVQGVFTGEYYMAV